MDEVFQAIWPNAAITYKEIRCRHCGAQNRVQLIQALSEPQRYLCARCDGALFVGLDEASKGLRAHSFEHPLDASALRNLRSIPGAGAVVKIIQKHFDESSIKHNLMASTVRCGEGQFPELCSLVNLTSARLGHEESVTPYVSSYPFVNAYTGSGQGAYIVFTSEIFSQFNDEQLRFIIGHELGHVLSEHALYRRVARHLLESGLSMLPGLARYGSLPLRMALFKWLRCSELSADRAGLLACRNLKTALESLFITACGNNTGLSARATLSLPAFIAQAKDLSEQNGQNFIPSLLNAYATHTHSHPMTAWRVLELIDWVEHGNYLNILANDYV